jgi:hypothetical protein
MSRRLVFATIVLTFALAGGVAYATIPDSGGVIHACYVKSGGALHVIDASVTNCKKNETAIDWSVQGQAGAPGPVGPAGATGPAGPAGPQGLKGDAGPAGAAGPQGLKGDTGATGPQGSQGAQGPQGTQGPQGAAGAQGPAGTPSAYGEVNGFADPPIFTASRSHNIVGTRKVGTGVYCVVLDPSIDLSTVVVLTSVRFNSGEVSPTVSGCTNGSAAGVQFNGRDGAGNSVDQVFYFAVLP